ERFVKYLDSGSQRVHEGFYFGRSHALPSRSGRILKGLAQKTYALTKEVVPDPEQRKPREGKGSHVFPREQPIGDTPRFAVRDREFDERSSGRIGNARPVERHSQPGPNQFFLEDGIRLVDPSIEVLIGADVRRA